MMISDHQGIAVATVLSSHVNKRGEHVISILFVCLFIYFFLVINLSSFFYILINEYKKKKYSLDFEIKV